MRIRRPPPHYRRHRPLCPPAATATTSHYPAHTTPHHTTLHHSARLYSPPPPPPHPRSLPWPVLTHLKPLTLASCQRLPRGVDPQRKHPVTPTRRLPAATQIHTDDDFMVHASGTSCAHGCPGRALCENALAAARHTVRARSASATSLPLPPASSNHTAMPSARTLAPPRPCPLSLSLSALARSLQASFSFCIDMRS